MLNDESLKTQWQSLDDEIRTWWDKDLRVAQEEQICDPALNRIWYSDEEHRKREEQHGEQNKRTLLFLPYPYISGGGSEQAFPEMYCWDIYFVNRGLAAHGRYDIIRNHILNQLFSIERFGMILTGNRAYYLTRTQTPIHPASIELYYQHHPDRDLLLRAYPVLKKEYDGYWLAAHHQTPTGLATNRDLSELKGTKLDEQFRDRLRPELAAEAEVLDFTSIFAGDIRKCVPLQTNFALVRFTKILSWIAAEIGWPDESRRWEIETTNRTEKINELCWNEEKGFYFEYNFEQRKQLPFWSLAAYWSMWAGIANPNQAARLVENLTRFEHEYGLAQTVEAYPIPHPEFTALQWDYPSCWPPMQIMVVEALEKYGFHEEARRIAGKFLRMQLNVYQKTGYLWEKYNAVSGNVELPRERYHSVPLHNWSCAAVVLLGRKIFSE